MPKKSQIRCVRKADRPNPCERITHIGGFVTSRWELTQEEAVASIKRGEWAFYVVLANPNRSVWVEVAVTGSGAEYLRTQGDSDESNNLLSLPECP